tara:strand:+ start:1710 stop:3287 length:1578 start_codon:yes stop_codon:yes gene_type:complete
MAKSEETIAERFRAMDTKREAKLQRARYAASLTIPSLLPPKGSTEQDQIDQTFSSVSSRGVTSMASRILAAMLPLNDAPFFSFSNRMGTEMSVEVWNYLDALSYQVHRKLSSKNLREVIFQALQHLIVVGDVLVVMEDDYSFRLIRLDHYVAKRDVNGECLEVIFLEFVPSTEDIDHTYFTQGTGPQDRAGYDTVYNRVVKEDNVWKVTKEKNDEVFETGEYKICPFTPLRWSEIAGENYGRSHCEDMIGDIATLESYTEALIEGMAAGSAFFLCVDPAGITEIDDINGYPNGSWVPARQQDLFVMSPSQTMNPQIQAAATAVETLRKEVGNGFLLNSSAIPSGDRVTATAVRMVGQELEQVLGGAFSAISRNLLVPIVERTIFLMLSEGLVDDRLEQQFTEEGLLTVEIVTGLQSLSRDSDLQKLMQMGEMVRNLPEQAMAMFRWEEYGRALITALGFDSSNWVKSEEEVMEQQRKLQEEQQQQQIQQGMLQQAQGVAAQAAQQDIEQTGGQGIAQVAQQMGIG